uniref:hypothetical protein n=1 Tax=Fomitopsis dickinsii TaxID=3151107 RepID=UPI002A7F201C|nr:hypothetical protein UYH45_mgp29 [Daedalea dickinsii]WNZ34341.1 hypothetical protein [Daedalea dickinsii]
MWDRSFFWWKGICDAGRNGGAILGAAIGIDSIREYKGLEPIFKPIFAKLIPTEYTEEAKTLINERKILLKNNNDLNVLDEELKVYKLLFDSINKDDYLLVSKKISENRELITNENSQIMQGKILKALDELKNNRK